MKNDALEPFAPLLLLSLLYSITSLTSGYRRWGIFPIFTWGSLFRGA